MNNETKAEVPVLRLRGGKGGFGSMLRAAGGKMSSKKTTNFEACRDLSGRRMKTVNDAKKLAEFVEHEADRKKKKLEAAKQKIERGLQEHAPPKVRLDDNGFLEEHEKVIDAVKDNVSKAVKVSLKRKRQVDKEAPQKQALWADEDASSDEDKM